MSKRIDAVLAEAQEKSNAVVAAIPEARATHRLNAERVVTICKEIVAARPAREPLTPLVSEAGQVRYGRFPAEQSLLNRYGEILRIWRAAYGKVIDITAPIPTKKAGDVAISGEDLANLDAGTRSRVEIMMALLREQKLETDRLKKLLRDNVPAPGQQVLNGAPHAPAQVSAQALREWLSRLDSGSTGLDVDSVGVKISRRAKPGQLVIPLDVLEVMRALSGAKASPNVLLLNGGAEKI